MRAALFRFFPSVLRRSRSCFASTKRLFSESMTPPLGKRLYHSDAPVGRLAVLLNFTRCCYFGLIFVLVTMVQQHPRNSIPPPPRLTHRFLDGANV